MVSNIFEFCQENIYYIEIGVKIDHSLTKCYEVETYENVTELLFINPLRGDSNLIFFFIIQSDVENLCSIMFVGKVSKVSLRLEWWCR